MFKNSLPRDRLQTGSNNLLLHKSRTTCTPAYLCHLIHEYQPEHCLRSADELFLNKILLHSGAERTLLALSAKAFGVSAPFAWNYLSYNCRSCQSCKPLSIFRVTELFNVTASTLLSLDDHYAPMIRLRHVALYEFVLID